MSVGTSQVSGVANGSGPGATGAGAAGGAGAGSSLLRASAALPGGLLEQPLSFAVNGEDLRGILIAGPQARATGLLFLHGWGGTRGGPHNLLTHLARAAASAGYPSLRFDFRGRGESAGDGLQATLPGMASDCLAAAEVLQKQAGVNKLVLVGLCSGGNVGIGALDRLPQVSGLYLMSVYPFSDADSFGREARRTMNYLREYRRKLFMGSTWRRLLRGELDLGGVWRVLFGRWRRPAAKAAASPPASPASGPAGAPASLPGQTPVALGGPPPQPGGQRHLDKLLLRRPAVHMVYGAADPDFQLSWDYFQAFARRGGLPIVFKQMPGANHNFYAQAWTQELTTDLQTFLRSLP